ncbi:hypothetical protein HELRODRAFT_177231 [Helobdella robusta]|uniref:Uncharacterized protein n=1 Tax=Helobdella robusta TaxID=6412 RepID=T1FBD9_HELRO|nr:hypothetical protein HELRODRAFT_177231 [Helobdella robusta]ESN98345.1 hypothetical protein HELRODRAFT_177231 [Helobdella robusta]
MAFEVHKFDSGEFLHVILLDDVENFEDLNDVVTCNLNVVLLNPELIVDIFQVYVAVLKALTNKSNNKMITKSFQSEVLFSVSPSKNIYGITEKELSCSTIVDSVVSRVATKDFL